MISNVSFCLGSVKGLYRCDTTRVCDLVMTKLDARVVLTGSSHLQHVSCSPSGLEGFRSM